MDVEGAETLFWAFLLTAPFITALTEDGISKLCDK